MTPGAERLWALYVQQNHAHDWTPWGQAMGVPTRGHWDEETDAYVPPVWTYARGRQCRTCGLWDFVEVTPRQMN
jgi:hypothetical protein